MKSFTLNTTIDRTLRSTQCTVGKCFVIYIYIYMFVMWQKLRAVGFQLNMEGYCTRYY